MGEKKTQDFKAPSENFSEGIHPFMAHPPDQKIKGNCIITHLKKKKKKINPFSLCSFAMKNTSPFSCTFKPREHGVEMASDYLINN